MLAVLPVEIDGDAACFAMGEVRLCARFRRSRISGEAAGEQRARSARARAEPDLTSRSLGAHYVELELRLPASRVEKLVIPHSGKIEVDQWVRKHSTAPSVGGRTCSLTVH